VTDGGTKADAGRENCFDNMDNNNDGLTDCGDPTCAGVGVCVTEPDNFALGVLIDKSAACPAGTTETKVFRGLTGGTTCTGCTCTPNPVTCDADIYAYGTVADCNADTTNTGGSLAGHVNAPCVDTHTLNSNVVTNGGFRASIVVVGQTCNGVGSASVSPASWTDSKKFCSYGLKGGGCPVGKKCVPVQADVNAQCALNSGSALCTGFNTTQNDWYTGYNDSRSCGACGCTAYGGACQYAQIQIGSDYTCAPTVAQYLQSGQKTCQGSYVPSVGLTANKVDPMCTPSSTFSGSLSPVGQQTLCCSPR
jgi:hypothetical protein